MKSSSWSDQHRSGVMGGNKMPIDSLHFSFLMILGILRQNDWNAIDKISADQLEGQFLERLVPAGLALQVHPAGGAGG